MEIVVHPNEILRKKSSDIKPENVLSYKDFLPDFIKTMIEKDGIGLAAPQVGKNINLITINKLAAKSDEHLILINPKINYYSPKTSIAEEGCLSVPDIFGDVERSEKIRIKALNPAGEKFNLKAKGMLARVIQHEVDHLNGILFIDKLVK